MEGRFDEVNEIFQLEERNIDSVKLCAEGTFYYYYYTNGEECYPQYIADAKLFISFQSEKNNDD